MGKFIVDSSIWIDFFRKKLSSEILSNLITGIENDQVAVTDIIVHELLVGTMTKNHYREMKDILSPFTQLRIQDHELDDYNQFAWGIHRLGLKGKYTDLTIAFLSYHHDYPVLSQDAYFKKLANKNLIQVIQK